MNRSILLVICDFLLLSLLALARFDAPVTEQDAPEEQGELVTPEAELVDVLKMSLEAERETQQEMLARLEEAKNTLENKDKSISEIETTLSQTQSELAQEREEKANVIEQREMLKQEKGDLAQNLLQLREQNAIERERLRQAQLEIDQREKELEETLQTVEQVEGEKRKLEEEKQMVLTELKVAETRQTLIAQQLENTKLEIEFERKQREEAQKRAESLTEGVKALAGTSVEIKEEIKQMQPKTPNALFTEYKRNRVSVRFNTTFPGIFQTREKTYEAETILISDTQQTYAILHTDLTPFDLTDITPVYDHVSLEIEIGDTVYRPEKLAFMRIDPRLIVIPIDASVLEGSDIKVYPIVLEPFRFPKAVVINSKKNYFGESSFKIHPVHSNALEMDKKIFSQLFGEFSPSRGDLVFAQTGEFMGLMVNNDFAALIDHISTSDTIWVGELFDPERTNTIVTKLSGYIYRQL